MVGNTLCFTCIVFPHSDDHPEIRLHTSSTFKTATAEKMTSEDEIKDKENIIEELRERLKGEMKQDMYEDKYMFYRFLKARDFNVNNAENMLRKHLEWRKEHDVDNLLKDFKQPEVLLKYAPNQLLCHDKDGCPVRYAPFGNVDTKGINLSVKFEDLLRRLIHDNEEDVDDMKKQSKKLGRNIDKCIYVYNMKNFTFARATNKATIVNLMVLLKIWQDNYPEHMKFAFIINASYYFTLIYSALKAVLASSILNKVLIFSEDGWKEELLKHIDASELPAFLGGTRTDPDGNPLCHTFINHGGEVPAKYYKHKSHRSLAQIPGAEKVTLPRASFHEVNIEVSKPLSCIEWEFETKCRDIGFGLFYNDTVDDKEVNLELIPIQRIDTDEFAETGMYKCEKTGNYVAVFDNTYSWVRAKELCFRITVSSQTEKEDKAIENNCF